MPETHVFSASPAPSLHGPPPSSLYRPPPSSLYRPPSFLSPVAPAVLPPVGFDALDHGQSSASATSPAFTGFASTYAITEASSLSVRIQRSKYSRCQKGSPFRPAIALARTAVAVFTQRKISGTL